MDESLFDSGNIIYCLLLSVDRPRRTLIYKPYFQEGFEGFLSERLSIYFLLLKSMSKRAGLLSDSLDTDDDSIKLLPRVFIFKRSDTIAVGDIFPSSPKFSPETTFIAGDSSV